MYSKTKIIIFTLMLFSLFIINVKADITQKWTYDTNMVTGGGLAPLVADINKDGQMEIIYAGDGNPDTIYCFRGIDGSLLWSTQNPFNMVPHNPTMISDLDKDGYLEIIQPSSNGMAVFHYDGSLYWKNSQIKSSEAHQLVLDTDHNGLPYIYSCCTRITGGRMGELRKIDGRTGNTLIKKDIWYPCHGGLGAADMEGDGDYEIIMTDRSSWFNSPSSEESQGKGPQCYDAETLDLIWSRPDILCSSMQPAIIDVNGDNILDIIVFQERNMDAGLYCLDGKTGHNIPGKYQDKIVGLPCHEAFCVYDIDQDGSLEVITACYSNAVVFDIGLWRIDATLGYDGKSPSCANVDGDEKLEIILADEVSKIQIYDSNYQKVDEITGSSYGAVVQDIDHDGLNEIIKVSSTGELVVYDTDAKAPDPLPNTMVNHYGERNLRAGIAQSQSGIPFFKLDTGLIALVSVVAVALFIFKRR